METTTNQVTTIHIGIGYLELTNDEVKEMYNDVNFLQDAVLYLLNKELMESSWDFHYDNDRFMDYLKGYFLHEHKGGYDREFIAKAFKLESPTYMVEYGEEYGNEIEYHSLDFFHEDRGFYDEDIEDIKKLEIDKTHVISIDEQVRVTRIV